MKQGELGYCYLYIVKKWHVILPRSLIIFSPSASENPQLFTSGCLLRYVLLLPVACVCPALGINWVVNISSVFLMLTTLHPCFGCYHKGEFTPFPHNFLKMKATLGFLPGLH